MKDSDGSRNRRSLIIVCVALLVFASVPLLSSAHSTSTSVTISNNSNRQIVSIYLSSVAVDNWGDDQLGEDTIAPGQSSSLNGIACGEQQIKVIAEDQDGCFLLTVISCGQSSTWTITSETTRDCGQ